MQYLFPKFSFTLQLVTYKSDECAFLDPMSQRIKCVHTLICITMVWQNWGLYMITQGITMTTANHRRILTLYFPWRGACCVNWKRDVPSSHKNFLNYGMEKELLRSQLEVHQFCLDKQLTMDCYTNMQLFLWCILNIENEYHTLYIT